MNASRLKLVQPTSPGMPRAVERCGALRPYASQRHDAPIDLHLDANEGPPTWIDIAEMAQRVGESGVQRYPSVGALERAIADSLGISPEQVVLTAGGDEAIDRVCRTYLEPGREAIVPAPTFEMIGRYARLTGAVVRTPAWDEPRFPLSQVLDAISPQTAVIAVVSPNNPTGAVATRRDLEHISAAAPTAVVLVDLAYTEFADVDLTPASLELPNAVIIRTFSKAFGLAGLRLGYAAGAADVMGAVRCAGSPYPVSALSLAIATEALRTAGQHLPQVVTRVRYERRELATVLVGLGASLRVTPDGGQANFVLADVGDPAALVDRLARRGIGIRRFSATAGLERAVRITCPGNEVAFERLLAALREALSSSANSGVIQEGET